MKIIALIQVTYEMSENDITFTDGLTDANEWSEYKMVKHFQEHGKVVDEKIIVDDNGSCYAWDNYSHEEKDNE